MESFFLKSLWSHFFWFGYFQNLFVVFPHIQKLDGLTKMINMNASVFHSIPKYHISN
jgi:hypothetical protein